MDKLCLLLIILTLGSCYRRVEEKHVNEEAIEFQNLSTEQILNRAARDCENRHHEIK